MSRERCQVLVVGGGPSGLVAALSLAAEGIEVCLVEKESGTSRWPRATHVSRRTTEILRPLGVQDDLQAAGMRVVGEVTDDPARLPARVIAAPSLADIGTAKVIDDGLAELAVPGPTPAYWCGQDLLEPILLAHARAAGADIRFGAELVGYQTVPGGVRAVVSTATGEKVVHARYLIGADGSRSTVRAVAGLPRQGLGLLADRASVLFDADLDDVVRGCRFFVCLITGAPRETAVMELNGRHRWATSIALDPARGESAADLTPARCRALLDEAIGREVEPRLRTVFGWRIWHRVADRFGSGPVFLVGDAAHIHAPAGGFGSNVGMQDAHNLAWKLAWVLRGWAGEDLLDTYDAERRPVGAAMTDQTAMLAGVAGPTLAGTARLPVPAMVYAARYSSAAVIGAEPVNGKQDAFTTAVDPTGAPGTRMPHLWLRDRGRRVSPHDLCPGRMLLLSDNPGHRPTAHRLANDLGVPIRFAHVDPSTPGWSRITGAPGVALLVRPDGVVAWRGTVGADPLARWGSVVSSVLSRAVAPVPG